MFGKNKIKELENRLSEAETIIHSFDTMLNLSHLSENKSLACIYARVEVKDYVLKYLSK